MLDLLGVIHNTNFNIRIKWPLILSFSQHQPWQICLQPHSAVEFVVLAGLYFHLMLIVKCNCCYCVIGTGNNMQQSNGIPTVSCIRSLPLIHLSELSRRAVALHGSVTCMPRPEPRVLHRVYTLSGLFVEFATPAIHCHNCCSDP